MLALSGSIDVWLALGLDWGGGGGTNLSEILLLGESSLGESSLGESSLGESSLGESRVRVRVRVRSVSKSGEMVPHLLLLSWVISKVRGQRSTFLIQNGACQRLLAS